MKKKIIPKLWLVALFVFLSLKGYSQDNCATFYDFFNNGVTSFSTKWTSDLQNLTPAGVVPAPEIGLSVLGVATADNKTFYEFSNNGTGVSHMTVWDFDGASFTTTSTSNPTTMGVGTLGIATNDGEAFFEFVNIGGSVACRLWRRVGVSFAQVGFPIPAPSLNVNMLGMSTPNGIDFYEFYANGSGGASYNLIRFDGVNFNVVSTANSASPMGAIVNGVAMAYDDIDNDGIPNCEDNCRYDQNSNQADVDNDGIGDVCDPIDDSAVVCNQSAYLFQANDIYTVDLGSGETVLAKQDIISGDINAVGFNPKDGNIWGSIGSKKLIRVSQTFEKDEFKIGGLPVSGSFVGDVNSEGIYYIKSESKIYKVDLNPSSDTYLDYLGSINLSQSLDIHDWAFNANDGQLYTVTKGGNHLYKINPENGDVEDLGLVPILDGYNGAFGAVYFDSLGDFYVSFNDNGRIYRVKSVHLLSPGDSIISVLFANGPSSSKNDGARCMNAGIPVVNEDEDDDGISDEVDNCANIANADQADNDRDDLGDVCDEDDDNDGVDDDTDNCKLTENSSQVDNDEDGVGDACELDSDNDGVADDLDNCLNISNPNQLDADEDGIGDVCDNDADNDGVTDDLDNCVNTTNANQLDADEDGLGDACDNDSDNDGVTDDVDNCMHVSNADQADADNDGLGNVCDEDADNDGILNSVESCTEFVVPGSGVSFGGSFLYDEGSVSNVVGANIVLSSTKDYVLETGGQVVPTNNIYINGYDEESGPGTGKFTYASPPKFEVKQELIIKAFYFDYSPEYTSFELGPVIKFNTSKGVVIVNKILTTEERTQLNAKKWIPIEFRCTLPAGEVELYSFEFLLESIYGGVTPDGFDKLKSEVYGISVFEVYSDMLETSCTSDFDGDGVPDYLDLDSDNDGIYDADEAGHNIPNVNGRLVGSVGEDGIPDAVQAIAGVDSGNVDYEVADSEEFSDTYPNYIDQDADGDGCLDVVEAGFSDADENGYLGIGSFGAGLTVDGNGVVTSASGYTTPNADYLNANENVCADVDNDGVADAVDNCINDANADQLDSDNDGIGDACDEELTCENAPVWEYGTTYDVGDYVVHLDILYKAVASSTNEEPVESLVKWTDLGACEDEVPSDDDTDSSDNTDITANESCIAQYEGKDGESNHAMWLSNYKGSRARFYFENNAGQLVRYSDGSATLRGTLININDEDDKWSIEYNLKDAKNWNEWKALGRSYKNERRKAGDNYQDWAYYILDASTSKLVGLGDNAGQEKPVRHKPASYYYGFQIGLAANSKNANYGVSGWFEYQNENNNWVQGDINLDLATCEDFEDEDEDKIDDEVDNCVGVANPDQADADNDGIGDACDDDADNDGVTDDVDNCIDTPNPGQEDLDKDGIGDVCDVLNDLTSDCIDITCKEQMTFERFLVKHGYDDVVDGVVNPSPALAAIKHLNISNSRITDLNGIEHLIGLEVLVADANEFRVVDLSQNTSLKHVSMNYNHLEVLDVSGNANLEELYLKGNKLTGVDVSSNPLLRRLGLSENQIDDLDVSFNLLLELLEVKSNELESLNLGQNPNLEYLYAGFNKIDTIDLSGVLYLKELYLNHNNIGHLVDLESHEALQILNICNNPFVSTFSFDCLIEGETLEQFDTLEEYMVFMGLDLDGLVNGSIDPSTAVGEMKFLDISNRGIVDMTGIAYFISLEELHMVANKVEQLDVSSNTLLRVLNVSANKLASLDVSGLSLLCELYAGTNSLTSIDLSNNVDLKRLVLRSNKLTNLDLAVNEKLEYVEVKANLLEDINLRYKQSLTHLYVDNNKLTSLDLSAALNLIVLSAENNLLLGTLDLDKNKCLIIVNVKNNQLEQLKFKNDFNSRVPNDSFNILGNPNLSCVKVDDVTFSTLNWTWYVEDSSVFTTSDDCEESVELVEEEVLRVENRAVVEPEDVINLKVFDQTGRLVANRSLSGVYFVMMVDVDGELKIAKIVVPD
ncbi:thrombospondin type 3 repeat-containing protein [Wenyingzhuangia sp. IMCC45574]